MQTEEVVSFLESAPIRIAVFGEFSAGKTTFLNALIGEDLLSVAVDPTTAVPTRVRYGREFNIFVELTGGTDGSTNGSETKRLFEDDPPFWTRFVGRGSALNTLRKEKGQIRSFLKAWTKEGERADEVERVVVELPLDWLKSGLELVDTPGANNEFTRHQGFTRQEAQAADIAVMLMDVRQGGGKRSEFDFMNEVGRSATRSFVALNKMDLIDADEREEAREYVAEEALPKHWDGPTPPPVVGLSALVALAPEEHDEPELAEAFRGFVGRIERLAEEERGKILLGRVGNPEQKLYGRARSLESQNRHDRAHRTWFELLDVLEAAGMDTQPATDGIARCEEELTDQVEALDRLHARYEEAIRGEQEAPDATLERLRTIQAEMQDLGVPDADVDDAVARLAERIEQRDAARAAITEAARRVKEHRAAERFIEAASAVEKIPPQLETAEPSGDRRAELERFVEENVQQRDEWAQERWDALSSKARAHLEANEYRAAAELVEPIETVQPFLSGDGKPNRPSLPQRHEAEQLAATIQERFAAYQSYESESEEVVEASRRLLSRDRANVEDAKPLCDRLDALAARYDDLYGAGDDLPKLPHLDDDAPCLTIDEKVAMAAFLRGVAQEAGSTEQAQELLETLRERQSSIEAVSRSKKNATKKLQRLDGYPDHPGFVEHLNELQSSTPGWWAAPFSLSRRITLLEEYKSFWPDGEKVERQVKELTAAKQRAVRVYSSVGGVLLLAVTLVSFAFVSEYRQFHALSGMEREAQIAAAHDLYHDSWFYGDDTQAWIQKTAAVPLAVMKRTGPREDELIGAVGSWHEEKAVQKLQAGNRAGAIEHAKQAPAQSREGILERIVSLEAEAGNYVEAMRTAENMPGVESPSRAVQLVANGCAADACDAIADAANTYLIKKSDSVGKVGLDAALSLLQVGDLEVALSLARRFGDASSQRLDGGHPFWKEAKNRLVQAVKRGNTGNVRVMLQAGVGPDVEDVYGNTALNIAVRSKNSEVVRLLRQAGATATSSGRNRLSEKLMKAATRGDEQSVRTLIAAGADPNVERASGISRSTPLMEAAKNGYVETVRELLEAGAEPSVVAGEGGGTALIMAATNGHAETVQALLAGGADPNAVTGIMGSTPLAAAVEGSDSETVRAILDAGANPNVGKSALIAAAKKGSVDLVRTLLEAGTNRCAKGSFGRTALDVAARQNHYSVLRLLRAAGICDVAPDANTVEVQKGWAASENGRFSVDILGGEVSKVSRSRIRVKLTVRQQSESFSGTWSFWKSVLKKSYLTDGNGSRYRTKISESNGWEDGRVSSGDSRSGTIVFYGQPSTPEKSIPEKVTLHFAYVPTGDPSYISVQSPVR